ncbi:hypothetical protein ABC382_00745 [Lysinibacillus sp. 1P01SD]|uniref:hypothetical protein n=1 Tax=Lysinibacillus sp. 1P01SD TaxID=3132285 RepID=UPI0039A04918
MNYLIEGNCINEEVRTFNSYEEALEGIKEIKCSIQSVKSNELYLELFAFDDSIGQTEKSRKLYRREKAILTEGNKIEWIDDNVEFKPLFIINEGIQESKELVKIDDTIFSINSFNSLTLGKAYTVINIYFDSIVITDDNGNAFAYNHTNFTL